jgi:3-oxoacyl-(acyl-carrier-protein) synthase
MAGALSGETALIEAAALLAAGAADRMLVVAGDCLTRPLYEYYEAKGVLDPACFPADPHDVALPRLHRVPGEGLVACLLETEESAAARTPRVLGRYLGGWVGAVDPQACRHAAAHDAAAGPFAFDGPALFESATGRMAAEAWVAPGSDRSGVMAAAVRLLEGGSRVGLFGGAGLWNVGDALARAHGSTASAILATNVDTCRAQGSAILVAGEGCL